MSPGELPIALPQASSPKPLSLSGLLAAVFSEVLLCAGLDDIIDRDAVQPDAAGVGDGAALLPGRCACGNPHLLRLTGKLGLDSLKYAGITLRADMVELALTRAADIVENDFRLHLREETAGGRPRPALELCLALRDKRVLGPAREELAGKLAGVLAAALHVSSSRTLEDLVKEGQFVPLKVTLLDGFPEGEMKPLRLISHV